MRKLLYTLALSLLSCSVGIAQNFQKFNLGENELQRYNPASAINDGSQAFVFYRYDWVSSKGYGENPNNIAGGMNLNFKWGAISADFDYDGYSFFTRHDLHVSYSYLWTFNNSRHSTLSAGGGISFGIDNIKFDKLDYTGKLSGKGVYCSPDFSLGVEYNDDKIRAGLGMVNLVASGQKFLPSDNLSRPPKANPEGDLLVRNPRVIMAYFIYRADFSGFGLSPIVFVGYSERTEVSAGLRLDWKKHIAFTYSFRAMEMTHNCTLNFAIPKTPILLDIAYSKCAFYKDSSLSGGLVVRWK